MARTIIKKATQKKCLCCFAPLRPTDLYAGHLGCMREWVCPKCHFRWWWDTEPNRPLRVSMSARSDPYDTRLGTREARLLKVIPPGELTLGRDRIVAYNENGEVSYRYHRETKSWYKFERRGK